MFGHHYFGVRFFSDRYFGDGGAGVYVSFTPANPAMFRLVRRRALIARRRR